MLLRARVNDAARAVMPAYALGADLDQLAALMGITRLVITPVVQSAQIVDYTVTATVKTFAGPDASIVLRESRARLNAYVAACHRLGRDVTRSGIYAALHGEGVQNVTLTAPAADLVIDRTQASRCTAMTITHAGTDE